MKGSGKVKQKMASSEFEALVQERTKSKCLCRVGKMGTVTGLLHWHESYEICKIIEGSARFLVDGVNYELEKGDLVCINAAVPHLSCAGKDGATICLYKSLPSNFMQISPSVKPLKVHISYAEQEKIDGFLPALDTLFDVLIKKRDVPADESDALAQSFSASLYFLLMEHFGTDGEYKSKSKERKIFFNILDYVNEHFTEPINVNVLSEKLFYPRGRLSAIFTKYSGIKLTDYISRLRTERVCELLRRGESITDAAFSSGFQNIRTFNNVYREVMGVSPSEYLKA